MTAEAISSADSAEGQGGCWPISAILAAPDASHALPQYVHDSGAEPEGPLAIIADTQRTSFWECSFLLREINDVEQQTVLAALGAESPRPSRLVHVGDKVYQGDSAAHWAFFDNVMKPVTDAGIPVLPMIGNHEADFGSYAAAREHMGKRWPDFQLPGLTYYTSVWNSSIALVMLDSNKDNLGIDGWVAQAEWFAAAMQRFGEDPVIRGILVFVHHAPYTNSPIVDPDLNVQDAFVPTLCSSRKALAMISGHAHGYERFEGASASARRDGMASAAIRSQCGNRKIPFIVSGGGGGPREGYRPESKWGLRDVATGDAAKYEEKSFHFKTAHGRRPFNYLLLSQRSAASLTVRVRGIAKNETRVHDLETFELPFDSL